MPSSLTEKQVQSLALAYLKKRYRKRCWPRPVFAREEVRTRKRYGGRRADGLLAFRHWVWGTYVVSLEAKSIKTLGALRPKFEEGRFLWNCLKFGAMACLLSGAFMALFKLDDGLYQFFFPLNVFLLTGMLYGLFTFSSYRHRQLDVIRQLERYPANEQWLAFSEGSFTAMKTEKQKQLLAICTARGIGVLIVQKNKTVKRKKRTKRRWKWSGDFLKYYSQQKEIGEVIRG